MNIIDNIRTFFVNILEWIKGAFSIPPTESIDPEVAFLAKLDTKVTHSMRIRNGM